MQKSNWTNLYNLIKRPLVLVLLVLAIFFVFQRVNIIPSFRNWFKRKPLLIENTPLVITQIKNIAQLQTVRMYAELVADSTIVTNVGIANEALRNIGVFTLPFAEKKVIVLITRGRVIAGIDLSKIHDDQVFINDDSVSVRLPAAEILEVITNPSDIETFIENGKWTDEEVRAVKNSARRRLLEEAARQNLLKKASDRARMVIEQFLRLTGFKKVHIEIGDSL